LGLGALAADAPDLQDGLAESGGPLVDRRGHGGQHRLEEAVPRFAYLELGRVHAGGDASRPGIDIVADQGALAPGVKMPRRVERQRNSRYDHPLLERG
jgi:hypothetical protein